MPDSTLIILYLQAGESFHRLPADMKFEDLFISPLERFSIGIEENSGEYYISIPVRNSMAEYSEYYRIPAELYEEYKTDLSKLIVIVNECRNRLRDEDLILKPGRDRGEPI